jgi:hypothetical protein
MYMKKMILALCIAVGLTACTNYGDKVSKDYLEVYYKDGATKEEAQKTLDYLYPQWKSDGPKTDKKSVQLTKKGDTICFRMVVDKDKLKDIDDETFYAMSNLFSEKLFDGKAVNMVFTDNGFKEIKTLVYKKVEADAPQYGEKFSSGTIEVYAKDGFSMDQTKTLAEYLDKKMGGSQTISFQVTKADDGSAIVRMATDEAKVQQIGDAPFKELTKEISEKVFNGGEVTLELTDLRFNPYKKFMSTQQEMPDSTVQ